MPLVGMGLNALQEYTRLSSEPLSPWQTAEWERNAKNRTESPLCSFDTNWNILFLFIYLFWSYTLPNPQGL